MAKRDKAPLVTITEKDGKFTADLILFDTTKTVKDFEHVNPIFHAYLVDSSIQALIAVIELIWPKWLDADQYAGQVAAIRKANQGE